MPRRSPSEAKGRRQRKENTSAQAKQTAKKGGREGREKKKKIL